MTGVAELEYKLETSDIFNSSSLRLVRLCVKQIHILIQQRPKFFLPPSSNSIKSTMKISKFH